MAVDVGTSPSEEPLGGPAERWDTGDTEDTGDGGAGLAGSGHGRPAAPSASPPAFPRANPSVDAAEPPGAGRWFLSEGQKVKAWGSWEPVSSPPSPAGSIQGSRLGRGRAGLGAEPPRPRSPESPGAALPRPEAPGSGPGSPGVPSAEGRALRRRLPGPVLGYRSAAEISSCQADYWACAAPDSLPPSPDRSSPRWNPHKEYEELLDYAYPLKPRYKLGRMPEPFLHDSGIGLDSFSASDGVSSSTSILGRAGPARGSGDSGLWEIVASAERFRFSTPRPGKRGCSGAGSYYDPLPLTKTSFARSASSHPSRGFAEDIRVELSGPSSPGRPATNGGSWDSRGSPWPDSTGQVESSSGFLPTTAVLPLRREWEADEEFLPLPPRLQELEGLAQFLSNLSLTIRMPGHDRRTVPQQSSSERAGLTPAPCGEARGGEGGGDAEGSAGLWQRRGSRRPGWESAEGRVHGDPPPGLRDTRRGPCLHQPRVKGHPEKSQHSESLIHCVKMFCGQLEELLGWLYSTADAAGGWLPPSPAAPGALASLRRCLEFRKDVAEHRRLTESVLERGEALLACMASNSPALKDTLGLIARQSAALESHAEQLYESTLAAVGRDPAGEAAAPARSPGAASVRPRLR